MSTYNCKNITKAIKNSRDLFNIAKEKMDSGKMDEAKKNLELAEKLTLIGPLRYKKFDRLASTIYPDLKPGEAFGNSVTDHSVQDIAISADGTRVSVMYKDSNNKVRYFDHDPNNWDYTGSRDVSISNFDRGIFSRDGESIISISNGIIIGKERYILDIKDKFSGRTELPIFTNLPDEVAHLAESKDGKNIYLVYRGGKAEIISKKSERTPVEIQGEMIEKMFDLDDKHRVQICYNVLTKVSSIIVSGPISNAEFTVREDEKIEGCLKSMIKNELIYFTSKRIMIKNLHYGEKKEFCLCERKFFIDDKGTVGKSAFGEELASFRLSQLIESLDESVLIGLYEDGVFRIWDRLSGRLIKEAKTYRNGVDFTKMVLLPDGSVGIGGTEGFAEKWGLPKEKDE